MLKKIFAGALLAISALGIFSTVTAEAHCYYYGGGYCDEYDRGCCRG